VSAGSAHGGVTIGVEEEFHLVDPADRTLADAAERVLAITERDGADVQAELKRSELETATPVCTALPELRDQIAVQRRELLAAADEAGVGVVASGTLPAPPGQASRPFPKRRYERLVAEYAEVGREQLVCAMQVQVGVEDRDAAVAALPGIAPWMPVLLALSGSSPFSGGVDTGYASWRSVVWSRWPSAGPPPAPGTGEGWDGLVTDLVRSGTIGDDGMVYFDVRPSRRYPTLELRICDSTPLLDDVVTLAGLGRALVVTALRSPAPAYRPELVRAASWRAARSGITGVLVDPREPVARPARIVVDAFVEHVRPALDELGDAERVLSGVDGLLRRGTSAERQRAAYARAGRLADAVDELLAETRTL
jgi:glutamate---cysteine ligase / carboxylate-amine ligase